MKTKKYLDSNKDYQLKFTMNKIIGITFYKTIVFVCLFVWLVGFCLGFFLHVCCLFVCLFYQSNKTSTKDIQKVAIQILIRALEY